MWVEQGFLAKVNFGAEIKDLRPAIVLFHHDVLPYLTIQRSCLHLCQGRVKSRWFSRINLIKSLRHLLLSSCHIPLIMASGHILFRPLIIGNENRDRTTIALNNGCLALRSHIKQVAPTLACLITTHRIKHLRLLFDMISIVRFCKVRSITTLSDCQAISLEVVCSL